MKTGRLVRDPDLEPICQISRRTGKLDPEPAGKTTPEPANWRGAQNLGDDAEVIFYLPQLKSVRVSTEMNIIWYKML